ncbi:MAG: O-antigen ligase family protein [bacterium]
MSIIFFTPLLGGTERGASVWLVHSLVFLLLALWAVEMAGSRKKVRPVRTPLDYPILCFVLLSVLSAAFSVSPAQSLWTLWNFFDYIVLFYIIVNKFSLKDSPQVKLILSTIIAAGSTAALLGLLKYLGSSARILSYTYYNPNPFGAYLAMVIPIALVMVLHARDFGKKIIISYCICLMVIAFILTLSRGGWISLLGALLVMAVLHQRKSGTLSGRIFVSLLPVIGAIFLCVAVMGYCSVRKEVAGLMSKQRIESVSGRVPIWKGTWGIIRAYPLLGGGPGTFPLLCEEYVKNHVGDLRDKYAHSEYLQVMSEWGVFSLGIILWILAVFFSQFSRDILRHGHNLPNCSGLEYSGVCSPSRSIPWPSLPSIQWLMRSFV